jgi:anionic cell wall polymer biosynthesis LytR-Cps2A-Psr (LCP) family protein
MDVNGFVKMVNAVGGIHVVNPKAITDPTYDWLDGGRTRMASTCPPARTT